MDDIINFIIGRIGSITLLPVSTNAVVKNGIRITEIPEPTIRMDVNGYSAKESAYIRIDIITPSTGPKPVEWENIHTNLKQLMRTPTTINGRIYYVDTVSKVAMRYLADNKLQNHGIDVVVYYYSNT